MARRATTRNHTRRARVSPGFDFIVPCGQGAVAGRGTMSPALAANHQGQDEEPECQSPKYTSEDREVGVSAGT
jgi:hypothetical protein